MTQFVIYGVMDENKNLTLEKDIQLCQGENKTTQLSVQVPNQMATGCDFYFEFLCPHNLWMSPQATATVGEKYTEVSYLLSDAILQEEGDVFVQLVARKRDDQTILYKSSLSTEASIVVRRSVNASATNPRTEDFFGNANNLMQEVQSKLQTLSAVAFSGSYADLEGKPQHVDLVTEQSVEGAKIFADLRIASRKDGVVKICNDSADTVDKNLYLPFRNDNLNGYSSRRLAMSYFYTTIDQIMAGSSYENLADQIVSDMITIPYCDGAEIVIYLQSIYDDVKLSKLTFNEGELEYSFEANKTGTVCVRLTHFYDEGYFGVSVDGKPVGYLYEYDWHEDFDCPYFLLQVDVEAWASNEVSYNVLVK